MHLWFERRDSARAFDRIRCVGVRATVAASCRSAAVSPGLPAEALADLRSDFDELLYLCRDADGKLGDAALDLAAGSLHVATRDLLQRQLAGSRRRYRAIAARLLALADGARRVTPSPALAEELTREKASLAD